jgi:hypothetical protein
MWLAATSAKYSASGSESLPPNDSNITGSELSPRTAAAAAFRSSFIPSMTLEMNTRMPVAEVDISAGNGGTAAAARSTRSNVSRPHRRNATHTQRQSVTTNYLRSHAVREGRKRHIGTRDRASMPTLCSSDRPKIEGLVYLLFCPNPLRLMRRGAYSVDGPGVKIRTTSIRSSR